MLTITSAKFHDLLDGAPEIIFSDLDPMLANTPPPPYYAVIFSNTLEVDDPAYPEMANRMVELASQQPGYLGVESSRGDNGMGITVSYWTDEAAILAWKAVGEHQLAQAKGRKEWYRSFFTRVAKVERAYSFFREEK